MQYLGGVRPFKGHRGRGLEPHKKKDQAVLCTGPHPLRAESKTGIGFGSFVYQDSATRYVMFSLKNKINMLSLKQHFSPMLLVTVGIRNQNLVDVRVLLTFLCRV